MMLKTINELSPKEIKDLIIFVNLPVGENLIDLVHKLNEVKTFKYRDLFELALENEKYNVKIDVSDIYEQIMFETYDIYFHLKNILNDSHKTYTNIDGLKKMFTFTETYEKLLSSSKFSNAETRAIQKIFFQNLLNEEIKKENYEYCSILKKTIEAI